MRVNTPLGSRTANMTQFNSVCRVTSLDLTDALVQPNSICHVMLNARVWIGPCARHAFTLLDVGCWMLDVGCWMLDVGCWMLDVGYAPVLTDAS
jgi:hypothetical protein